MLRLRKRDERRAARRDASQTQNPAQTHRPVSVWWPEVRSHSVVATMPVVTRSQVRMLTQNIARTPASISIRQSKDLYSSESCERRDRNGFSENICESIQGIFNSLEAKTCQNLIFKFRFWIRKEFSWNFSGLETQLG